MEKLLQLTLKVWLLLCFFTLTTTASAEETPYYTFKTAYSSNSTYAECYDLTISGMNWSVPGNQQFNGYLRIGGKDLTNVDRTITGKSPMDVEISQIVINHNGITNASLTVNSITLVVADDADFSLNKSEITLTPSFSVGTAGKVEFNGIWKAGAYYKFIFNLTNTHVKNNYGLDITSIDFYAGAVEPHTVIFNYGNTTTSLTETSGRAGVELLAVTPLEGWTFAGWATENISETEVKPTTIVGKAGDIYKPKADIALYAVYSNVIGTGKTIWKIITDLSKVTEGTYALLSNNAGAKAFNGVISSDGHGQSTTDTLTFADGVATFVPIGTLEIVLTKSGNGFTMYNADYGYLYAKKNASGNLAWHDTEGSYWSWSNGNWTYANNNAYLRVYKGTFRTYGTNNGQALYMAKKEENTKTIYTSKPKSETVSVSTAQFASLYYSDKNLIVPEGLEAITYTYNGGSTITPTISYKSGTVIPKDEAVVLHATEELSAKKDFYFAVTNTISPTKIADNILCGTDEDETITDSNNYFYRMINGSKGVGFYRSVDEHSFTNSAHKAYMKVDYNTGSNSSGVPVFISLLPEEGATAINLAAEKAAKTGTLYNYMGQKVSKNYCGIVIIERKKVISNGKK